MRINFKSSFLKSITTLASGSIVAQIIVLLVAPMLTRLYTPREMGIYTFMLTVVTMFASIICGRYDMSIVSEETETRIYPLIKVSFFICLLMSFLISISYGIYISFFSQEYGAYTYTIVFIFIILITKGVTLIMVSYNNRKKEYILMTSVHVIRTSAQNVGMVAFGFLKSGIFGLLFSYAFGELLGMNRQAKSLKPHFKEVRDVKMSEVVEVAKQHYKQPVFSVPAIFANNFSYSSINLFIEALFGTAVLGVYSISFRALGLPLSIVSGNVAKVFFQEASIEYHKTGQFRNTFKKTTLFLVALSILMVLCMIFLAAPLFGIVFGKEWEAAGNYVKILAPMFGIRFVVTSLTPGILIANKQNYELLLQLLFVVMSVAGFAIAKSMQLQINEFLAFVSIGFSVVYLVYFGVVYQCSKGKMIEIS